MHFFKIPLPIILILYWLALPTVIDWINYATNDSSNIEWANCSLSCPKPNMKLATLIFLITQYLVVKYTVLSAIIITYKFRDSCYTTSISHVNTQDSVWMTTVLYYLDYQYYINQRRVTSTVIGYLSCRYHSFHLCYIVVLFH